MPTIDSAVIFQFQSALILALLYLGLYWRKNRSRHVKIMSVAIAWDLLLILQIELNRGAVSIASKMMVNPWLLNFHVTIAVSTVVGYVALIVLGRKILAGQNQWKKIHGKIGGLTFLLRNATFVTSFMIPIQ